MVGDDALRQLIERTLELESRLRRLEVAPVGGGGSGATAFTGLTDTPSAYTGQAGKFVQVNAGATGLEFDAVAWDDVASKPSTFTPSAHNHAWADITSGLPAFTTRWPTWSEVTSKPTTFTPSSHAGSHKHGGTDQIATATPGANEIPKADADGKLNGGWIDDGDIDHGSVGGLGDDDHTQYHNDARGDARYYTKTQLQTGGSAVVHWDNITGEPTIPSVIGTPTDDNLTVWGAGATLEDGGVALGNVVRKDTTFVAGELAYVYNSTPPSIRSAGLTAANVVRKSATGTPAIGDVVYIDNDSPLTLRTAGFSVDDVARLSQAQTFTGNQRIDALLGVNVAPSTAAQLDVVSGAAGRHALRLKAAASPTVPVFEIDDSTSAQVFDVTGAGNVSADGYIRSNIGGMYGVSLPGMVSSETLTIDITTASANNNWQHTTEVTVVLGNTGSSTVRVNYRVIVAWSIGTIGTTATVRATDVQINDAQNCTITGATAITNGFRLQFAAGATFSSGRNYMLINDAIIGNIAVSASVA